MSLRRKKRSETGRKTGPNKWLSHTIEIMYVIVRNYFGRFFFVRNSFVIWIKSKLFVGSSLSTK